VLSCNTPGASTTSINDNKGMRASFPSPPLFLHDSRGASKDGLASCSCRGRMTCELLNHTCDHPSRGQTGSVPQDVNAGIARLYDSDRSRLCVRWRCLKDRAIHADRSSPPLTHFVHRADVARTVRRRDRGDDVAGAGPGC